jgi:coenzyme F420-reducing hydrogenase beta subunit
VTDGQRSIQNVIDKQFCVGCGACGAIAPDFQVQEARNGEFRVLSTPACPDSVLAAASRVCPMGSAPDEDELAALHFPDAPGLYEGVGRYRDLYAGWSPAHRSDAGSGGLTRWLMAHLLRQGEVDYVVQVSRKIEGESPDRDLFYYEVFSDADAYLARTSSSAYFPVSLQGLFDEIDARPGRCAVTALPCFARAIRAVMLERPSLASKVRFVSGVICGSLKSRRYAEYLAQQMGVAKEELSRLNFRGKSQARVANEKCVEVWREGSPTHKPDGARRVQELRGTNYGQGYFKYKACDYCDDVLAETADVAFGDAWIKPYVDDPSGTNVVVVRNPKLAEIFRLASASGEIVLHTLTPEQVVKTQAAGLRHRRGGLAIRLSLARMAGAWTPKKRVQPGWGHPLAIGTQLYRIGVRRITSSERLPITSPWFERSMRLFNFVFRPILKADRRRLTRAQA